MKTKITEISTKYLITQGDYNIGVVKDLNGNISVYKSKYFNQRTFEFHNSKPEIVKAIGEMLVAASKIK